jgi:uncharacterized protein YndB with AHSA1/START domain
MIVEIATTIARPPAAVFAFVSDMRNESQWHTDVLQAWLVDGEAMAAGATFGVKIKPSMGLSEGTATVSEYAPPNRVVFDVRMNGMTSIITHMVSTEGAGSRVTRRIELKLPFPMRLAAPLVRPMIRKSNIQFLNNLRAVLESRPLTYEGSTTTSR